MRNKTCNFISSLFITTFISIPIVYAQVDYNDLSLWQEIKGVHFVVKYSLDEDESISRDVLRAAEEYYDKIARQIGYSRYNDFWTWEERVKIIIFPNQLSFSVTTNQPLWSRGYAVRDSKLFESRVIVTFKQEEGFIENLLPHEISHLILKDFIGFDRLVPLWFDEGVAQQQEKPDEISERNMGLLVRNKEYLSFDTLNQLNIRYESDGRKVTIFYVQSRLIIEFLIKNYGQDAFQRLCHNIKDAMSFEDALKGAYAPSIDSMKTLESKWVSYMSDK